MRTRNIHKAIIVGNGDSPQKSVILKLQKVGYNTLIAADGGANSLFKLGLLPDLIIGDFDSITGNVKAYYSDKSEFIKRKEQSDTDVEKALKYLIKKKFKDVVLLGVSGRRIDHGIANLSLVLKYSSLINIKVIAGSSVLSVLDKSKTIRAAVGETISVFGFAPNGQITSTGLEFPLKDSSLFFGTEESISNKAITTQVSFQIKSGKFFIVRAFKTVWKNGFI